MAWWNQSGGGGDPVPPTAGSSRLVIPVALLLLLAVGVRLWIDLRVYHYFIDDAYIFMRYAENSAAGRGLVFNPGEWVLGFTSPLFMILVAALTRGFSPLDAAPVITALNAVLFLAFAALVVRMFVNGSLRSLALPAVLMLYFPFVDASLNGMETTLMLATLFGGLFLLARGRHGLAVGAAALCALTRPEGVVFLVLVTAFLLLTARDRFPWRSWLAMALLGGAWAAFAQKFYGTFLPQSMVAKSALAWIARPGQNTPLEMHLFLSTGLTDTLFHGLGPPLRLGFMLGVAGLTLLFLVGAVQLARRRSPFAIAAGFYVLVLALFAVGNPVDLSSWHTIPTAATFLVVVFAGLESLLERVHSAALDAALLAALLVFCAVSVRVALPFRTRAINGTQGSMERFADYVRAQAPGARSIASGHIGLVGRRSGLRIVDLGALVTPAILRYGSFAELVAREKPDVIMAAPTILVEGADPKYPHAFPTEDERREFVATYEATAEGGVHAFVRRTLLPTARE